MEPWAAAKKALSLCGGATSSCPGSWPMATYPECHVSYVSQLMIRVIMRLYQGVYTNLLKGEKNPRKPQLEDRL